MTVNQTLKRRDRWADWAVVVLVAIALILGLALREFALYSTKPFEDTDADISGLYPRNWVRETDDDPLLRVSDPRSGDFNATLEVRSRPMGKDADSMLVLDALARERARQVDAYQVLNTDRVLVEGEETPHRTFTYVQVNNNPYTDQLPVVVRGADLALRDEDGRVVVVTLLADTDDFDAYQRYFYALVESLEF